MVGWIEVWRPEARSPGRQLVRDSGRRGCVGGGRGMGPGTPTDNGEHWWTPSVTFTIPQSQVTLLDFGASREFGTEFTDHYIEVSAPQPWLGSLKGQASSQILRLAESPGQNVKL